MANYDIGIGFEGEAALAGFERMAQKMDLMTRSMHQLLTAQDRLGASQSIKDFAAGANGLGAASSGIKTAAQAHREQATTAGQAAQQEKSLREELKRAAEAAAGARDQFNSAADAQKNMGGASSFADSIARKRIKTLKLKTKEIRHGAEAAEMDRIATLEAAGADAKNVQTLREAARAYYEEKRATKAAAEAKKDDIKESKTLARAQAQGIAAQKRADAAAQKFISTLEKQADGLRKTAKTSEEHAAAMHRQSGASSNLLAKIDALVARNKALAAATKRLAEEEEKRAARLEQQKGADTGIQKFIAQLERQADRHRKNAKSAEEHTAVLHRQSGASGHLVAKMEALLSRNKALETAEKRLSLEEARRNDILKRQRKSLQEKFAAQQQVDNQAKQVIAGLQREIALFGKGAAEVAKYNDSLLASKGASKELTDKIANLRSALANQHSEAERGATVWGRTRALLGATAQGTRAATAATRRHWQELRRARDEGRLGAQAAQSLGAAMRGTLAGGARVAAAAVKRFSRAMRSGVQHMREASRGGRSLSSTLVGLVAAYASLHVGMRAVNVALDQFVKKPLAVSSELQTLNTSFVTLTGSTAASQAMLRELVDFSARTPFQIQGLARANKLLLTFGGTVVANEKNLTRVGDAASAVGAPLQNVTMWFGRAYSMIQNGKPLGEVFLRLSELGLAMPGVSTRLEEMRKAGASTNEMWETFSTQFDKFAGGMERQSKTLAGRFSTLKDNVNITYKTIGDSGPLQVATSAVETFTAAIKEYNDNGEGAIAIGEFVAETMILIAGTAAVAARGVGGATKAFIAMKEAAVVLSDPSKLYNPVYWDLAAKKYEKSAAEIDAATRKSAILLVKTTKSMQEALDRFREERKKDRKQAEAEQAAALAAVKAHDAAMQAKIKRDQEAEKHRKKLAESQKEYNESLKEYAENLRHERESIGLTTEREKALLFIREQREEALLAGVSLSRAYVRAVMDEARALDAATLAEERRQAVISRSDALRDQIRDYQKKIYYLGMSERAQALDAIATEDLEGENRELAETLQNLIHAYHDKIEAQEADNLALEKQIDLTRELGSALGDLFGHIGGDSFVGGLNVGGVFDTIANWMDPEYNRPSLTWGTGIGAGVGGLNAGFSAASTHGSGTKDSQLEGAINGAIAGFATTGSWVGAAIGLLSGLLGGGGATGSDWGTVGTGVSVGIHGGTVTGSLDQYQTRDRAWFGGTESRTWSEYMDRETRLSIQAMLNNVRGGLLAAVKELGYDPSLLDDINAEFTIDTDGMSPEQITAAINAELARMADSWAFEIVPHMEILLQANELAAEELQKIAVAMSYTERHLDQIFGTSVDDLISEQFLGETLSAYLSQLNQQTIDRIATATGAAPQWVRGESDEGVNAEAWKAWRQAVWDYAAAHREEFEAAGETLITEAELLTAARDYYIDQLTDEAGGAERLAESWAIYTNRYVEVTDFAIKNMRRALATEQEKAGELFGQLKTSSDLFNRDMKAAIEGGGLSPAELNAWLELSRIMDAMARIQTDMATALGEVRDMSTLTVSEYSALADRTAALNTHLTALNTGFGDMTAQVLGMGDALRLTEQQVLGIETVFGSGDSFARDLEGFYKKILPAEELAARETAAFTSTLHRFGLTVGEVEAGGHGLITTMVEQAIATAKTAEDWKKVQAMLTALGPAAAHFIGDLEDVKDAVENAFSSTAEGYKFVADKFGTEQQKLEAAGERAAQDLAGAGVSVAELMSMGRKGFFEAATAAEKLGQTQAATKLHNIAEAASEFFDSVEGLEDLARQAAEEVEALADSFSSLFDEIAGDIRELQGLGRVDLDAARAAIDAAGTPQERIAAIKAYKDAFLSNQQSLIEAERTATEERIRLAEQAHDQATELEKEQHDAQVEAARELLQVYESIMERVAGWSKLLASPETRGLTPLQTANYFKDQFSAEVAGFVAGRNNGEEVESMFRAALESGRAVWGTSAAGANRVSQLETLMNQAIAYAGGLEAPVVPDPLEFAEKTAFNTAESAASSGRTAELTAATVGELNRLQDLVKEEEKALRDQQADLEAAAVGRWDSLLDKQDEQTGWLARLYGALTNRRTLPGTDTETGGIDPGGVTGPVSSVDDKPTREDLINTINPLTAATETGFGSLTVAVTDFRGDVVAGFHDTMGMVSAHHDDSINNLDHLADEVSRAADAVTTAIMVQTNTLSANINAVEEAVKTNTDRLEKAIEKAGKKPTEPSLVEGAAR